MRDGDLEKPGPGPESIPSPSRDSPPNRKGHSPICDCATRVEVRSHSGEKGRPSSASLSPWGGNSTGKLDGVRLGEVGGWLWEKRNFSVFDLEMDDMQMACNHS